MNNKKEARISTSAKQLNIKKSFLRLYFISIFSGDKASFVADIATFSIAGDLPVAGDYSGDDKTEIGVFCPSEGKFYSGNVGNATMAKINVFIAGK